MIVTVADKAFHRSGVLQPTSIIMHFPAKNASPENLVRFVEDSGLT
jgi:hypothetical protein